MLKVLVFSAIVASVVANLIAYHFYEERAKRASFDERFHFKPHSHVPACEPKRQRGIA